MGAPQSQALCGIQIQPPVPHWSILRRFLLRHAPPDYRTRRQSTCRTGARVHGSLENGLSHRAGLSSDATLECSSEHRDRRCARSDLYSAAGFLNRAPWRRADKGPSLGRRGGAHLPRSGGENYSDNVETPVTGFQPVTGVSTFLRRSGRQGRPPHWLGQFSVGRASLPASDSLPGCHWSSHIFAVLISLFTCCCDAVCEAEASG